MRPETLKKVLESVKLARPRRVYLIADGPRKNRPDDIENCKKCREVAEKSIDWDCEVIKLYNNENKGLFITYFEQMGKVFQREDFCIFMEDDVVASKSFFFYCEELLYRYRNDLRLAFVTGINLMPNGIYDKPEADYFFCGEGSLQAYGLWKRTFESMNMDFLRFEYVVQAAEELAKHIKPGYDKRIAKYKKNLMWQGHIPHVEIYKNLLRILENQICVVPTKNLVMNIGISDGGTHIANDIRKIPKAKWCFYNTPIYDLSFPLKHPRYMVNDITYEKRMNYLLAWQKPVLAFVRRTEAVFRHIIYGDMKRVKEKFRLVLTGKYVFDE